MDEWILARMRHFLGRAETGASRRFGERDKRCGVSSTTRHLRPWFCTKGALASTRPGAEAFRFSPSTEVIAENYSRSASDC